MIRKNSRKKIYTLVCFFVCACRIEYTQAANNSINTQQIAIQRIENYRNYVFRTGDFKSKLNELHQAEKELMDSYLSFMRESNNAAAALSQIELGYIQRASNNWEKAKINYQQAYELAKKANHKEYQAKARLNHAKAEQSALDEITRKTSAKDPSGSFLKLQLNSSIAKAYAQEAVQLANELNDPRLLYDALEVQGNVFMKSGDLDAASHILEQAISVAKASADETRMLYAYMNHADLNSEKAWTCMSTGGYLPNCPDNDPTAWCYDRPYPEKIYVSCYKAHEEALSDSDESLKLARKMGLNGLEELLEKQVEELGNRKCNIQVFECLNKNFAKLWPLIRSAKVSKQEGDEQFARVRSECKLACVNKLPQGIMNEFFQHVF